MENLTALEKIIYDATIAAWRAYTQCESQHPDEQDTMRRAIHQIQDLLAVRLAQRTFPELFPIK